MQSAIPYSVVRVQYRKYMRYLVVCTPWLVRNSFDGVVLDLENGSCDTLHRFMLLEPINFSCLQALGIVYMATE